MATTSFIRPNISKLCNHSKHFQTILDSSKCIQIQCLNQNESNMYCVKAQAPGRGHRAEWSWIHTWAGKRGRACSGKATQVRSCQNGRVLNSSLVKSPWNWPNKARLNIVWDWCASNVRPFTAQTVSCRRRPTTVSMSWCRWTFKHLGNSNPVDTWESQKAPQKFHLA